VKLAYDALTAADAEYHAPDARAALAAAYEREETDEFVKPTVIGDFGGIADGDAVVMINFRADRAREILTALTDPAFDGFERAVRPNLCAAVGMTEYSSALTEFLDTLFPPEDLADTLGEAVAKAERTQLRIAETEKYAHVTFFLNGGRETVFDGEERILVQSPNVKTYDLQPEMSAPELTDRLVEAIGSGRFDLIVVNYANPDMVGHTGVMDAAIKAVETVDACVARVDEAVAAAGGVMLITADHGNVELMRNAETGNPHTAHTTTPVPLILTNAGALARPVHLKEGRLADLAPTVLTLMGLPVPGDMTGTNLLADGAAEERLEAS
jgi:2,3-bisphosphoglycerate-independent phosphoglycerate mutase